MKLIGNIVPPALGMAALAWVAVAVAGGEKPAPAPPSTQKAEEAGQTRTSLHGGYVTKTKSHHFETVFGSDGVRVYMYSADQYPLSLEKATGVVGIKDGSGSAREVKLVTLQPKEGEKTIYFCTMNDTPPATAAGDCPKCGMQLVRQTGLFAAADLSQAKPGSVTAEVRLTGLPGAEKEVTFAQTNAPPQAEEPNRK